MSVELVEVDPESPVHLSYLYALLGEREAHQSISHKAMPTYSEHKAFVASEPYEAWYLIRDEGKMTFFLGATYLSKNKEIGIGVFKRYHRQGIGEAAVQLLMQRHKGPFLANINPNNAPSIAFFKRLGFEFLQVTFSHE